MTERLKVLAALFGAARGVEVFAVADIVQRIHLSTAAAIPGTFEVANCDFKLAALGRRAIRPVRTWGSAIHLRIQDPSPNHCSAVLALGA
jgi:hypothetical protein